MSDVNSQPVTAVNAGDESAPSPSPVASVARRRLLKLGTVSVPVVATLASRPALAWHCKSPSAWGSEIINPNTSLKTNAGHQSYPDETWYISNWRDNVARSSAGFTAKPWEVLYAKFPSIKDPSTSTSGQFDYKKVTVGKLKSVIAGFASTANSNDNVVAVLTSGSDLPRSTIVAQLNYILLSPLAANQMESCLSPQALQAMAKGNYSPQGSGQTWSASQIKTYLYNNYIAR